jgi:hypothetical protein
MADTNGRPVAGPLRRGSPFCLLHAKPFTHVPAVAKGPLVLLMLDLETTGVDVSRCRIVEIAATQAVGRLGLPGACFAQVVKVPDEILRTPAAVAASAVHGIDSAEIAGSHTFPMVWARFLEFVERDYFWAHIFYFCMGAKTRPNKCMMSKQVALLRFKAVQI